MRGSLHSSTTVVVRSFAVPEITFIRSGKGMGKSPDIAPIAARTAITAISVRFTVAGRMRRRA
jgi:hypothetical protein